MLSIHLDFLTQTHKKSAGLLVYSHFEVFGVTQVDE